MTYKLTFELEFSEPLTAEETQCIIDRAVEPIGCVGYTFQLVDCNKHEWVAHIDSMFHNEHSEDVYCKHCLVSGEKSLNTGHVFYPAT